MPLGAVVGLVLVAGCTGGDAPDATGEPATVEQSPAPESADPDPTSTSASATVTPTETEPPPDPGPRVVTTGLEAPWSVAFVGGTPLVSERDSARILELSDDGAAREVGVVAGVQTAGEGGLLGLAVDDDDRLYVYSTGDDGNRVQRYDLQGDPGSYDLGDPTTILEGIPAARSHDGGRLAFGPDGMLYASTGDARVRGSAQDRGSLAGKILRMTPDGDVPDDNPFDDSLVYSYGHRNVQGLAWADDGTMFATEFGQDTWDELNVITPGANYGWPEVEGITGDSGEYTDPVQQWSPDEASPSGMAAIGGALYVANLRGAVLRSVPVDDPTTSTDLFTGYGRLRDAVESPDGELWFLTNATDGRGEPGPDDDRIVAVAVPAD
ncbi:oxidoreductase [Paraoerskovia sediminicola]|uniref:Oxidoreductase n=1 Tax=Paraoerskovia sediminicola TaxID=1138587 RepID=A0ABN6XAR4_9CELL|nr:oxidoreductase [Paraoerskovia sediminicola]